MAEPTNTKKREVMEVRKGKIDLPRLLKTKQGYLPPEDSAKKKSEFNTSLPEGMQDMDLKKVDNDNKGSYNGETIKKKEPTMKNIDFDKLHDDFAATVDSKKKPGAGE